ncbi:hypothetical protein KKB18_11320 [bacterium]|nr:hypothetical protein [bacterium]
MKITIHIFMLILSGLLLTCPAQKAEENPSQSIKDQTVINSRDNLEKEVIAKGSSPIKDGNIASAKESAKKDAFKQAIEQVVGVFIDNRIRVEKGLLIENRIISKSRGYIKKFDVIGEESIKDNYFVTIKAVVSQESIKDDLEAICLLQEQMNYPRLMILIGSEGKGTDEAADSARVELERIFTEKCFNLIDPAASERLNHDTAYLRNITQNPVNAARIGLEYHADVLILGSISLLRTGKTNSGFITSRTRLQIRVIDPTTAKLSFSKEDEETGQGFSDKEALTASGKKVASKISDYLITRIIESWRDIDQTGNLFKVTLKNAEDYNDALTFEDIIKDTSGVTNLSEKSFGSGVLECDVRYVGNKSEFQKAVIEQMMKKTGFENINIKSSQGNNIVFSKE